MHVAVYGYVFDNAYTTTQGQLKGHTLNVVSHIPSIMSQSELISADRLPPFIVRCLMPLCNKVKEKNPKRNEMEGKGEEGKRERERQSERNRDREETKGKGGERKRRKKWGDRLTERYSSSM